jgi:parvulin-like peptidyl-prolyl isomerase
MKAALGVLALCALAAVSAGCGGLPGNAVAEVDGQSIERDAFQHWMQIAAKSGGQPNARVPRPDTEEYDRLRDQVLQLLVSHAWVRGEAEEMGIEVSDSEVRERFDQQKRQNFPNDEDFRRFMRDSGQTEQDLLLQVRLDLLSTKITEKVVEGKDRVSDAQVEAFYEENRERFAQPERRDLRIVLTRNRARAEQARAALQGGDSWRSVAREFSTDEASKAQGGKLPAQAEGTLEPALDRAVFRARRGRVSGPVKTQFGHYVFEVEKVEAAAQQTLEQARQTIRQTLQSQNQQQAIDDFSREFQRKWRERTECREGFVTPSCKNGPEPTPTPTPGGPPGQPG